MTAYDSGSDCRISRGVRLARIGVHLMVETCCAPNSIARSTARNSPSRASVAWSVANMVGARMRDANIKAW
ncbi:hypothetical protein GCM10023317_00910 [Actinopolymorpha pittospori]